MDQDDIAKMFRAQRLKQDEGRRQRLINELALVNEQLTPEEQLINEAAVKELQVANRRQERLIRGGYWKRLWLALRGK